MQEWKCVYRKWNVYVLETDSNVSISHTVHFLLNLSVAFNHIIPVSVKLADYTLADAIYQIKVLLCDEAFDDCFLAPPQPD